MNTSTAPRKRDAQATRSAILQAAKAQFAELGYDRATLRGIAAEASADVALINRYFGGKEGLFTAALEASFRADFLDQLNLLTFPREFATAMADNVTFSKQDATNSFQFLLQAATSPSTAPLLNVAMQERFLGPIRQWLGGEHSSIRARAVAAAVIGLQVERLIRDEPLCGDERVQFIDRASEIIKVAIRG